MNSSCAPAITEIVEGFTPAARSETIAGPELEGEPPQAAKASGKSRIALCIDSSGMNGTSGRDDDLAGDRKTSELQSQSNLVCRLLLEKKKKIYATSGTVIRLFTVSGAR